MQRQLGGQTTATVGIHSRETETRLEGDGLTGAHRDVIHSSNNKTQMTDNQKLRNRTIVTATH